MGRYKVDQTTGEISLLAGRGKAEYGASTVRSGRVTGTLANVGSYLLINVTFDTPMPDTDYLVEFSHDYLADVYVNLNSKTVNGFTFIVSTFNSGDAGSTIKIDYTAYKLYTDVEYNEVLDTINKVNDSGRTSVTDVIWTIGYNNYVVKNGNVVNIQAGGVVSSPVSITPNSTIICKIPEGYRPKINTVILGLSAPTSSGTRKVTSYTVKTNGDIVYSGGSSTESMGFFYLLSSWGI